MLKSMTGYGRGEFDGPTGSYVVEVSSTNHRFLEVKMRLSRGWAAYESRIQKEISGRFRRGHFDLYLTERERRQTRAGQRGLALDWGLADEYVQSLRALKKRLGLVGRIDVALIAAMKDVFSAQDPMATEERWGDMRKALQGALDHLEGMRVQEGSSLQAQIADGFGEVERLLESIRSRWPEAKTEHQDRIRARVQEMVQGQKVEGARLEQELALWAERWDIAEEGLRLQSHLRQARVFLAQESPSGRPLDFLLQEMNREANTISAKAADSSISQYVIAMKSELEKIREQVQNVE